MASNNDRASLPQRKNGNNKKNRENQAKLIQYLTEMFGTTFETDIIASVAQTCKWKAEKSVDTLIALSSTAQSPKSSVSDELPIYDPWESTQPTIDSDLAGQIDDMRITEPKVETASLCGLKVEYRPKGMENNSDDDADVVIEEESSDYRLGTPEPTQRSVNVCQFLETPAVQCPPRNTLTKVNYINTASPPCSPARNNNRNNNNNNNNNNVSSKPLTTQARVESDICNGYKVMILMRGCPGSGKTYLSKDIVTKTCGQGSDFSKFIFSSDDYFAMINRGVYVFDASKLQDAHSFNQNRVLNAARQGWSPIIVDNTNTQAWEMQYYVNVGVDNGYIVETLEPNTSWFRNAAELERRNRHHVSKPKIRTMLERYEPALSGDRLIRMFKLTYKTTNQPPQLRKLPPLSHPEPQKPQIVPIPQRRSRRPKSSVEDMSQVCDALSTIAMEYSNLETVVTTSKSISTGIDIITNDSSIKQSNSETWTDGSSYKEDSFLSLEKLGAIGSERRASNAGINNVISGNQKEKVINDVSKEEENLITLEPVSTERTNSLSKVEKVLSTNDGLSQCLDFTLLLDGIQIHSKLDEEILDTKTSVTTQTTNQQTIQTQNIEFPNNQIKKTQSIEPSDESKTEDSLKELSSPSESSSSSISSLERVDMSQFEMCSNPEATSALSITEVTEEKPSSTSGLGSILSFIKNSFLGNEKEKLLRQETADKDILTSKDSLTDKLRSSSIRDTSSKLSIISLDASIDTLSSKLANSNSSNDQTNLKCEIQECSILLGIESALELSGESDEFFEARDSLLLKPNERVVEELLEASSDFQVVNQYEEVVTYIKEKDETDGKFVSEKNFTEPTKNLQVLANFEEEDSKVLKEPIDRVFGGKNVFTEKMQNTSGSNALTPKPNNSNSNSHVDNVNLISWQESPFPLDDIIDSAVKTEPEDISKVETCDKESFTDTYDFNVAYVGGTDDYKVLQAFNRSINEPCAHSPDESPLHGKLMLHKGTMTSNTSVLLVGERPFELEIQPIEDASSNDRGEELVERYPQLPRACVLDVYENCRRDFNWALDYLDSLQLDQATVSAAVEQHIAEAEAKAADLPVESPTKSVEVPFPIPARTSGSSSSSSLSSSPQRQRSSRKEKTISSDAQLALKRQFEDKFVLSKESYKPHTLKVKRWKNRESKTTKKVAVKQEEIVTESLPRKPSRLDHPAVEEEIDNEDEEESSMEDEQEETMELKLGYEFVRVLEEEFGSGGAGNNNFQPPDGLFPVIQIRKSMAQELHALWVESMERQLSFMHEQLDAMIARDAEYARTLEQEEARAMPEPDEPNLKEIMEMEMALATFSNDRVSPKYSKRKHKKQKFKKESLRDMTSRVTERTLHDMFPDYEREMLHEIYEAHDRDFDETVRVIQENCSGKSTITMADALKKRKTLIDELQKESRYQTSRYNQLEIQESRDEASGGAYEEEDAEEEMTYEEALQIAQDSRDEARRQLELRNANYQKACEAYRGKNPEVAAYYADVAKLHIKSMERANATAASAYLAAQTYAHEDEDTLDLHHLRVEEALRALDIFLEYQLENMNKGARKNVFIITGRGARSINGQSRLKPAVATKLNQKSINFEEANPGMIKACLRKK